MKDIRENPAADPIAEVETVAESVDPMIEGAKNVAEGETCAGAPSAGSAQTSPGAGKSGARSLHLRFAVTAAVFAAMSIVLGKFAAIPIGDSIRISFENLPLILCSVLLGPVWGAGAAVVADLLGCVLRGYAIIPLITVSQGLIGLIPGLVTRAVFRRTTAPTTVVGAVCAHVVCSMGLKTLALSATYGMPFLTLLPMRVLTYLAIGALEAYLCATIVRVGAIRRSFGLPEIKRKEVTRK